MREIVLGKKAKELHIPISFYSAEDAKDKLELAANTLGAIGAKIITLEIFAPKSFEAAIADFTRGSEYPINWIYPLEQASKPLLAGAHITALSGIEPKFAKAGDSTRAVCYSDENISYCRTFGITSDIPNSDPYAHTIGNLHKLEKALSLFGFNYRDIVRTWFYNDDILSWYAPFNTARTDFYSERGIFGLLPASTGIGAPNPSGQRIISGAIAIKGAGPWTAEEVDSPLQCGAPKYGSSFSRAVEIRTPYSKRVMVSGTASIEAGGKTAHVGDIDRQIRLTLEVIEAILKSRGMNLSDTVRSVVYCLRPEYYENFTEWAKKNGTFPHCPSNSIVCRDDLLFEIELEAAVNTL